jgi:hypothetical protein
MSSLFPDSGEGFEPKAPDGVLARYCARCGAHIGAHGTEWRTAEGSVRTCPPAPAADDHAGFNSSAAQHDSTALTEEEEEEAQRYMTNPPFGTAFNAKAGSVTGGGGGKRHIPPPVPSPSGTGAAVVGDAVRMSKPANPQFRGSLRGSACDPSATRIDIDERRSVPARKSNQSSMAGAGLLCAYDDDDDAARRQN